MTSRHWWKNNEKPPSVARRMWVGLGGSAAANDDAANARSISSDLRARSINSKKKTDVGSS